MWLALLAPLFFLSYNLSNQYAASLPDVGSVVFGWESAIPLVPWTIIPYWSIDLLYGLAFLLPCERRHIDTLGWRLLTAQIVCIACFFLWPLRFSVERPELDGLFGSMFDLLMGFDKPFNQAPSLHITLLVVLWACYAVHLKGAWRWLMHGWFALIGLSVLTTWQHHFIDLPAGILAGYFCLWCCPMKSLNSVPQRGKNISRIVRRRRWILACYYALASLILGIILSIGAAGFPGIALLLIWPCITLMLVAINYAFWGAQGFQKQPSGRLSIAATILFAPYLLGAWINTKYWTKGQSPADEVVAGVWLGRIPDAREAKRYAGLMDMCAELPVTVADGCDYRYLPVLDLTPLTPEQCWQAARIIDGLVNADSQPILVFCALGYSRSSVALMAWLLLTEQAKNPEHAKLIIEHARPQVVIKPYHLEMLNEMVFLPEFYDYQLLQRVTEKRG
ncbi:phosphatase PAP2/dual specificity phosphatase family protein [Neptunomonas antarctica]|uniref:Dual specificity phosphatase, catalytic domain n=1 Tax=Neptunomonas antarctica TaxID=619304 RepID=A0A1N7NE67_9GAMM|nr:phosphatase PAP2/dual specificity phosphatase family protein [Neptunomonas antarctica]SIS96568.1 Dual specificity phosphatase, catalytic domain [Neptunomonas antarctica]